MSQYGEQLITVMNATEIERHDVLKAISQYMIVNDGVVDDYESIEKNN